MLQRRSLIPLSFTMVALVLGAFSVLRAATGDYAASAQLILLSMIMDGLDGKLARVLRGTSDIGAELDTFVDFTSFGLAPAVLAWLAALRDFGQIGTVLMVMIVVSGGLRLSRFRVADPHRGQHGYTGLPITVAGGWIAAAVFLVESGALPAETFSLVRGPFAAAVWLTALIFVLLQVSEIRFPKPTHNPAVFAIGLMAITALFLPRPYAAAGGLTLMFFALYMGFIAPWLPAAATENEEEDEEPAEEPLHPL